jgi:adenylate cyclase
MRQTLLDQVGQFKTVAALSVGIAASAIALNHWGFFNLIEWAIRDQWVRLHASSTVEERIIVVTIDESDLKAVGDWPIPDAVLAQLLEKVRQQQPRVIGLDLYRDLPEEPGHKQLVQVFRSTPNLIGVEKITGDRVNPPPVLMQLNQVALADMVLDSDRSVRRALLTAEDKGQVKAGLAAQAALKYLEAEGISLETIDAEQQKFRLGKAVFTPLRTTEANYGSADVGGYQILLNWWGNTSNYKTVSLRDVLADRIKPGSMRDRIVLIGSTAASSNDFFETPYSSSWNFQTQSAMPGVIVHANIVSQLLHSALNGRPVLRGFTWPSQWLWIVTWTVLGTAGSWFVAKQRTSNNSWTSIRWAAFLSLGVLCGSSYVTFSFGYIIPVTAPAIAFILGVVGSTNAYKQKCLVDANRALSEYSKTLEILNVAYERFVPAQFLSFLNKKSIIDVELGDQVEREMTILFSDIRDFTTISEQMTPAENIDFINEYLGYMEPKIQHYGGFIDKYIGDAIMALFPYSADDALKGAIAMLKQLNKYNQKRLERNKKPLSIGIGLHTGALMLGTVGGLGRMDGTAIGDAVNLCSRVEGLTKTYGISLLITHQTLARLNNPLEYDLRFIAQVKAKGKAKAVGLFEIFFADPPELRDAKITTKEKFERAVLFYHQELFTEAAHLFQKCVEYHDGDRAAHIYLDRCRSHIA